MRCKVLANQQARAVEIAIRILATPPFMLGDDACGGGYRREGMSPDLCHRARNKKKKKKKGATHGPCPG
jgi:hypothetical protein